MDGRGHEQQLTRRLFCDRIFDGVNTHGFDKVLRGAVFLISITYTYQSPFSVLGKPDESSRSNKKRRTDDAKKRSNKNKKRNERMEKDVEIGASCLIMQLASAVRAKG